MGPHKVMNTWKTCATKEKAGALTPTLEDVLELVLLQRGSHHLLNGADVFVQFDHQGVVVHAGGVGHDGVVALLGQGDEIVEAVNPTDRDAQ